MGRNIRKLRQMVSLTQQAFAVACGLSQGYLNQLESGKRKYNQRSLEAISRAFGIPVIEFFKEPSTSFYYGHHGDERSSHGNDDPRKEMMELLEGLPEKIVEHYMLFLKMEKEALKVRQDK